MSISVPNRSLKPFLSQSPVSSPIASDKGHRSVAGLLIAFGPLGQYSLSAALPAEAPLGLLDCLLPPQVRQCATPAHLLCEHSSGVWCVQISSFISSSQCFRKCEETSIFGAWGCWKLEKGGAARETLEIVQGQSQSDSEPSSLDFYGPLALIPVLQEKKMEAGRVWYLLIISIRVIREAVPPPFFPRALQGLQKIRLTYLCIYIYMYIKKYSAFQAFTTINPLWGKPRSDLGPELVPRP